MRNVSRTLLLVLLLGCGPAHGMPAYTGPMPSPVAMGPDFAERQRITVTQLRDPSQQHSFEGVLQKEGNTLTLVGLTPFGSRAFVLTQSGTRPLEFQKYIPIEIPFQPEYVLIDVHRVYDDLRSGQPNGWRTDIVGDESRSDRYENGLLAERIYLSSDRLKKIHVSYARDANGQATRIRLTNERFGYRLEITTLERL